MSNATNIQEDFITVAVDSVDVPCGASIGVASGVDVQAGVRVTFYGDARPMSILRLLVVDAVEAEDVMPMAAIEGWQVISRKPCN